MSVQHFCLVGTLRIAAALLRKKILMLVYYISKFSLLVTDVALVHPHQFSHVFLSIHFWKDTQICHHSVCPEGVFSSYQIGQFTFC